MIGNILSRNKHNTENQIQLYPSERSILRRMWNKRLKPNSIITPFKRININNNPKFVCDNSDYTRFIKQRTLLKSYKK